MSGYTTTLPTNPGTYSHQWVDARGTLQTQTLFVGYTNARAPLLQGRKPNDYMPRKLKCCRLDEHLHADRLTPQEWGGFWKQLQAGPNGIEEVV